MLSLALVYATPHVYLIHNSIKLVEWVQVDIIVSSIDSQRLRRKSLEDDEDVDVDGVGIDDDQIRRRRNRK